MTKRKKKTLLQRQKEIVVETGELSLVNIRSHWAMFNAAMKLEKQREPQPRYVR
jgi:hypothetical protein